MKKNLFLNWLEIELQDKSLAEALREINAACGTAYQHNWPSKMEKKGYTLERVPKQVRQYMMTKVLPTLINRKIGKKELQIMVEELT